MQVTPPTEPLCGSCWCRAADRFDVLFPPFLDHRLRAGLALSSPGMRHLYGAGDVAAKRCLWR